jgi:hypothetical protein
MLCPHCHAEVGIPADAFAMAGSSASMASTVPRFETDGTDALDGQGFFDTWLSPNMRVRDNVIQGMFTLLCVFVLSVWGFFFENQTFEGFLHGTIAGLVVGFLVSGFFLMVYRIFRPD